jgi:hypothetical protein
MRVLIFSLLVFMSGCGILKRFTSSPTPVPNPPPYTQKEVEFEKIDVNNDGTVTEEEVDKFNQIAGVPNKDSYDPWTAVKWFFLLVMTICVACCGPWAGQKIKEKIGPWKSD